MRIDPATQAVLDMMKAAGRPALNTLSPAEAREMSAAGRTILAPEPEDCADIRDMTAPGPNGPVPLRMYRPAGSADFQVLPALVYFHGGGWVLGDLDSHDSTCRILCNAARCCVISVDYRLAPEHRFPAAVSDSAAAVRWITGAAEQLAIDPARVAVGGDSAGGNLAAVMAIMARDGFLPPLCGQLLIYPSVDMAMQTPSSQRIREGFPLTTVTMKWFIDHYIADPAQVLDWRASPIRAASLAGVAPALVMTCTHDPLADEGRAYAQRLEQEDVPVTHLHVSDQIHAYLTWGKLVPAAGELHDMLGAWLRARLAA